MKTESLIRKLYSLLTNNEGGKSQAKVGDIKQICADLSDMIYREGTEGPVVKVLYDNGAKRAKKKKTPVKK